MGIELTNFPAPAPSWLDERSEQSRIRSEKRMPILPVINTNQPPTYAQEGIEYFGMGPNAHFWDGAEEQWRPTIEAVDNFFTGNYTNPVSRDKYAPYGIDFLSSVGKADYLVPSDYQNQGPNFGMQAFRQAELAAENKYLDNFFNIPGGADISNRSQGLYLDRILSNDGYWDPAPIAITNLGWDSMQPAPLAAPLEKQTNSGFIDERPYRSIGSHEFGGHYWDAIIGNRTDAAWKENDFVAPLAGSEIMDAYRLDENNHPFHQGEQNWNKDTLYNTWMNDPATAHLDVEDPTDRIHHAGRNNPREGLGQYIAAALTDPGYNSQWTGAYMGSPSEQFARAVQNSIRPQTDDEGFTGMSPELDRIFANSMATLLNSR